VITNQIRGTSDPFRALRLASPRRSLAARRAESQADGSGVDSAPLQRALRV